MTGCQAGMIFLCAEMALQPAAAQALLPNVADVCSSADNSGHKQLLNRDNMTSYLQDCCGLIRWKPEKAQGFSHRVLEGCHDWQPVRLLPPLLRVQQVIYTGDRC
jgi:hypothetical protein